MKEEIKSRKKNFNIVVDENPIINSFETLSGCISNEQLTSVVVSPDPFGASSDINIDCISSANFENGPLVAYTEQRTAWGHEGTTHLIQTNDALPHQEQTSVSDQVHRSATIIPYVCSILSSLSIIRCVSGLFAGLKSVHSIPISAHIRTCSNRVSPSGVPVPNLLPQLSSTYKFANMSYVYHRKLKYAVFNLFYFPIFLPSCLVF